MIKPDWNTFKTKFTENPQNNFEWFCYLLFCKEFDKPLGIFRYKNQSGLETNPIVKDSEIIGWQAKFYETKLSANKKVLIETVKNSKSSYPSLTKIIFYTHQEWSQSKGQESTVKKDVEQEAKDLGITIEWRMKSYFESPFVSVSNAEIAQHFFSLDKSILNILNEKQLHSENILYEIQVDIDFNNQKIEIDRKDTLENLQAELNRKQVVILSGVGGVGKTAIIKNLYEKIKDKAPFYVFKANEFDTNDINELFRGFTAKDFLDAHKDENYKIIVVDSAENLLNLKNTDPFKEFLAILIQRGWKLIFTTRGNYLEDLNYQFFEIFKIVPLNIAIQNLNSEELDNISNESHFVLPNDEKLKELIKNPFYLSEYLTFYKNSEETNYVDFKEKLWNKNIKKSKPEREICFLEIAFTRARDGQFFIIPTSDSTILEELRKDGILGHETAGYFITHDIYEEWALEKIIETEFIKKGNNKEFFDKVGNSLSMRRSFRNWISEKLLLENKDIKNFITEVTSDDTVELFWKDEILVSVLLSNYSERFFEIFSDLLLGDNFEFLKKLTFLLRLACKEVDESLFKKLGVKNLDLFSLKYVLTKPKGQGWVNLIKFVYKNLNRIQIKDILFVLPVMHDWNNKFREGETTRFASLIALDHYRSLINSDSYYSRDDNNQLIQTIVYGSSEIKNELKEIIDEIIKNRWNDHRDPYSDLSRFILTELEGTEVARVVPESVLKLADFFWFVAPTQDDFYDHSALEIGQHFGMVYGHFDYYPPSSYQTPIYCLLQSSLKKTIDFILEFTNKVTEYFAKTDIGKQEVEEIDVFIGTEKSVRQFISSRLWCTFRGTQVSPHNLESMHMALEKYFLEHGKHTDSKTLDDWLLYLLQNSKSASISGIVVSIVLAYPEKTFNTAEIIFKTKEFFSYDTSRYVLDLGHQNTFSMIKNTFGVNPKDEIYDTERQRANDEPHRKATLEHQFLKYQFFRREGTSEEEVENRQKKLWKILDEYYEELSNYSKGIEASNVWKLCLARMDRRKMQPTTEQTNEGFVIHLNPEIEPKLKEYSEKSLENISESTKYSSLNLWANFKMENDEKYKQYLQYENDYQFALKEVRQIVDSFKENIDKGFSVFNRSIPSTVCSVLLRDSFEKLSADEKIFCKEIVLGVASAPFRIDYKYQALDGMKPAISVLPVLLVKFPEEKEKIKTILLVTLFNDYPVDMANTNFNVFSIMAIHKLWGSHFNEAQSLLFGYLSLKPKYEELRKKLRQENHKEGIYDLHENHVLEKFWEENEEDLKDILENKISIGDLGDIEKKDLYILKTAFQLIPLKTENEDHKKIVQCIISAFVKELFLKKSEDKPEYSIRHSFLQKLAYFVLNASSVDIPKYLEPIINSFNSSEATGDLLQEFILAEDNLNTYQNFWNIWNLFYEKIISLCSDKNKSYYIDKILKSYLFAETIWKETTSSWHTFKDGDKRFFEKIVRNIGDYSSVLYSISKLLNDIGSIYLEEGMSWIYLMIDKNKNLKTDKLEEGSTYYLENALRKYVFKNREKIKKTKKLKQEALVVVNYLVEKGSVVGYILRENIL